MTGLCQWNCPYASECNHKKIFNSVSKVLLKFEVMDHKLFVGTLNFSRKFGLSVNYRNEGNWIRFLELWFQFLNFLIILKFRLNYLFKGNYRIEDLSDAISSLLANIESAIQISSIFFYGVAYKSLMEEITRKLEMGP